MRSIESRLMKSCSNLPNEISASVNSNSFRSKQKPAKLFQPTKQHDYENEQLNAPPFRAGFFPERIEWHPATPCSLV